METVCNLKRNVTESQHSNTSSTPQSTYDDDDDDDDNNSVWQDLIRIAPDPPDRRKKCEKCQ